MTIKTYQELSQLSSFEDRYRYLRLDGRVGADTFGFDRVFNQRFYASHEWKRVRHGVITRDMGCDLGIADREIFGRIIIHHMNPVTLRDLEEGNDILLNPEYLICVSHDTHNAIHYGDEHLLLHLPPERKPFDTCPWKN